MQAAFHVFGMELLATLDLAHTNAFFSTFFRLPDFYWRGFLSSELSSGQLIVFALLTYALAPLSIKWSLMRHLVSSPAGGYLVRAYLGAGPPGFSSVVISLALYPCPPLLPCLLWYSPYPPPSSPPPPSAPLGPSTQDG